MNLVSTLSQSVCSLCEFAAAGSLATDCLWRLSLAEMPLSFYGEHIKRMASVPEFPLSLESTPMQRLLNHFYFSLWCRAFYLVLIFANIVCIVWTVLQFGVFPSDRWFRTLEILISATVILELAVRVYLIGCPRFLTVANMVDILVGTLSVAVVWDSLSKAAVMPDLEGLVGDFWIALRTGTVYLRLLVLMKNRRRTDVETVQLNFSLPESPEDDLELTELPSKLSSEPPTRNSLD